MHRFQMKMNSNRERERKSKFEEKSEPPELQTEAGRFTEHLAV